MHILITGGAGFLGARLARALLARGSLAAGGGTAQPITTLTLTDRVAAPADLAADPRVRSVEGDLNDLLKGGALLAPDTSVVFHLAAAVSGECEADFDLGMRSNYEASMPGRASPARRPPAPCWRPAAHWARARCWCSPARWPCLATRPALPCPR